MRMKFIHVAAVAIALSVTAAEAVTSSSGDDRGSAYVRKGGIVHMSAVDESRKDILINRPDILINRPDVSATNRQLSFLFFFSRRTACGKGESCASWGKVVE